MFTRLQGVKLIVNEKKTKHMIVSATQKGRQTQNLKLGDKVFESVPSFKYLGNVIHKEGRISECVNDRILEGKRVYAANHQMLTSKIINRSAKMQIFKTLIRPAVTYGSETWTLTKSDENLLRILLKSRTSLTFFRACFIPGRANDLSALAKWGVPLLRSRTAVRIAVISDNTQI